VGIGALALIIPSVPQRDLATRIDTYLRPFVETNNFSGVIYIGRSEQVLFQRGYGLASPTFEIRNTPATRFHIASISKAFTAAAILLLEERGQLSTSDSVAKFLPDFPQGVKIRLGQLLNHSSGIHNVSTFAPKTPGTYAPYTAADLVAEIAKNPLDFEPGARFRYTNSDYNVLARIIEVVSKQPFGEFMQANVFDPLRLRATMHDDDARRVIADLAAGTGPDGLSGVNFVPYLDWSTKTGSGSLVSSAADLCRFARAVFGGKWLSRSSLAKIMQPGPSFPYGWDDRERGGRKVKAVGGRSPGFIVNVEYFLDDGTCVAILTNSYSSVGQVIAPDISAIAIGQSATPPRIAYARPAPAPGELAELAGRFQFPAEYYQPNAITTIRDRGNHLELAWPSGDASVIYPTGRDDFVDRTNWAMVHITRDARGEVTGFTYSLLQDFAVRKLP
jgi:CubicO group peptidase (beta-lactamase class C family)